MPILTTQLKPNVEFSDFPNFKLWYTPKQILEMGAFGGSYFYLVSSRAPLPLTLFDIPKAKYKSEPPGLIQINHFNILPERRYRNHELDEMARSIDPDGWFRWYCAFYYGRRTHWDSQRIAQWKDELLTLSHYIRQNGAIGTTKNFRFNDLNNPIYFEYRQYLLEYGWAFDKDPIDFMAI